MNAFQTNSLFKSFASLTAAKGFSVQFCNAHVDQYSKNYPQKAIAHAKIMTLPLAIFSATFIPLFHSCLAFVIGIPLASHGNTLHLKKYVYMIIRDYQGSIGRVISLFKESQGLHWVTLSKNYKKYYTYCSLMNNHLEKGSLPNFRNQYHTKASNFKRPSPPPYAKTQTQAPWVCPSDIKENNTKDAKFIKKILKIEHESIPLKRKSNSKTYDLETSKTILCKIFELDINNLQDQTIKTHYRKAMFILHSDKAKIKTKSTENACSFLTNVYDCYIKPTNL